MSGAIGYFVHHQGRGHAERAAALVNAIDPSFSVTLFCARDDIFPKLQDGVCIEKLPSLFEALEGSPRRPDLDATPTPSTLHCAPLGWRNITSAVAQLAGWFDRSAPALFITDVSAELAQLARIASVPCVPVLQHGDRSDPGHVAAYEGAVGFLAPYAQMLEQPDRPDWMLRKTHYAPGLGVSAVALDKATARQRLGLSESADIVLVVSGGGGSGTPATPVTLGARAEPDALWLTIGLIEHQWHETTPGNLRHLGWVDDPATYMSAADRIVSSAGDTTVHMIASIGRPWVVVPEWRYFDEQLFKARRLAAAGAAVGRESWPSHVDAWRDAWAQARRLDLEAQRSLTSLQSDKSAAAWLQDLHRRLWSSTMAEAVAASSSVHQDDEAISQAAA